MNARTTTVARDLYRRLAAPEPSPVEPIDEDDAWAWLLRKGEYRAAEFVRDVLLDEVTDAKLLEHMYLEGNGLQKFIRARVLQWAQSEGVTK